MESLSQVDRIIESIKNGGMPNATGVKFTKEEIDQIKSILQNKKDALDNYFNCVIAPRFAGGRKEWNYNQ